MVKRDGHQKSIDAAEIVTAFVLVPLIVSAFPAFAHALLGDRRGYLGYELGFGDLACFGQMPVPVKTSVAAGRNAVKLLPLY